MNRWAGSGHSPPARSGSIERGKADYKFLPTQAFEFRRHGSTRPPATTTICARLVHIFLIICLRSSENTRSSTSRRTATLTLTGSYQVQFICHSTTPARSTVETYASLEIGGKKSWENARVAKVCVTTCSVTPSSRAMSAAASIASC